MTLRSATERELSCCIFEGRLDLIYVIGVEKGEGVALLLSNLLNHVFRYLDHAESVEEKSSSEGEKDQPENMEKKEKIEQNIKSLSISCHLNR